MGNDFLQGLGGNNNLIIIIFFFLSKSVAGCTQKAKLSSVPPSSQVILVHELHQYSDRREICTDADQLCVCTAKVRYFHLEGTYPSKRGVESNPIEQTEV